MASMGILLAQIVGLGFACGLNLYATVAVVGLGSRFGLFSALPLGLRGLENGVIIGSALALYAVELVVDKIPHADSFWDAVHTIIRPLAAVLLALVAVSEAPIQEQIFVAVLAGAAALAMHVSKAGVRVFLNTRPRPLLTTGISLLEDAIAIGLTLAALMRPQLALPAVLLLILLLLIGAPRLWRAARCEVRAAIAWLRGFFGDPGWRPPERLPAPLRALVRPQELGSAPTRATRAALVGYRGAGPFRNGWLLFERGGMAFLYSSLLRPRRLELPQATTTTVRKRLLADMVDVQADHNQFTLLLLKDGPPAEVTMNEIAALQTGAR